MPISDSCQNESLSQASTVFGLVRASCLRGRSETWQNPKSTYTGAGLGDLFCRFKWTAKPAGPIIGCSRQPPKDDEMTRVLVLTVVLAFLAALSAVSIFVTAGTYTQAMAVVRALRLEVTGVEVADRGDPEVQVSFSLTNDAPVTIALDSFRFSLYLNEQFIGSNYEAFPKRELISKEEASLEFAIPIQSYYQKLLDQAEKNDLFSWSVKGRYRLILPFGEKTIWLNIEGGWSGS